MAAWRDCWGSLSWNGPYFLCDGHIYCAMVAERIFCPFSVECFSLLLSVVPLSLVSCFSFLSIGYFSFLVVEGCACFLLPPTFIPRTHFDASTTWNSRLRTYFPRLICTFCTLNPWFYCWGVDLFVVSGRWRERTPFPSHLIQWITAICCIPMKGEGEKRKTADARMRVRRVVRGLFFMGKQIAAVRLVIYSTNWEERLNHCYSYLVLARSDA